MWIKGSGKWLRDALAHDIFLPIDLQTGNPRIPSDNGLRPSIETLMHLALPQAVVVHVHSVNVLAWAVRGDGRRQLASRLDGLDWRWIPYVMPGEALAASIRAARACGSPDVFVLENHGLVVAADTVAQAQALLNAVEDRVRTPARPFDFLPSPELGRLLEETGWRPPLYPEVHGLAMDGVLCNLAQEGVLYPDHAVFLGEAPAFVGAGESAQASLAAHVERTLRPASFMVAEGVGVLVRPDLSVSADEMLRCLVLVASRLSSEAGVKCLSHSEVEALLAWDGEKFRQTLNQ